MENQSKKMVQIVYDALDEKLGEDIEILKVDEISVNCLAIRWFCRSTHLSVPNKGTFSVI